MEAVLRRLLAVARTLGVRFKCAYLDKGFCSVAVLRWQRLRRVPYIIPVPARGGEGGIKGLFDAGRGYQTHYTFKRRTKAAYATSVVIVCKYSRGRYKQPGVQYFAYAVHQLGRVVPRQVFERYRRRFGIESGYRRLQQVRARTASRNPALRLLMVGLALLLVNLWVLLCQSWISLTRYGQRVRIVELMPERVADALLDKIEQRLGVTTVSQVEAGLNGIQHVPLSLASPWRPSHLSVTVRVKT